MNESDVLFQVKQQIHLYRKRRKRLLRREVELFDRILCFINQDSSTLSKEIRVHERVIQLLELCVNTLDSMKVKGHK